MRLAWITDPHLDHLPGSARLFAQYIREETACDAAVITGDISTSQRIVEDLQALSEGLETPVYSVLGNHDYYYSSIDSVHESLNRVKSDSVRWLDEEHAIQLSESTALIGVGGWYDARLGLAESSTLMMQDFQIIKDFSHFSRKDRLDRIELIRSLADRAADLAREKLSTALNV